MMAKFLHFLKQKNYLPLTLILCTLMLGILIGTVISDPVDATSNTDDPITDATPLVVPRADPVENQFAELASAVRPSVVSIQVMAEVEEESSGENNPQGNSEDFFRRFFGIPEVPGQPSPRQRRPGQGSGVIVDPKGYIITNNHVVQDADRIQVSFADDEEIYDAKLIGTDIETDLAVIYVSQKKDMQAARIGNADAVNVGDWAIAIGSPFGYRETVTVGIISAKSREMGSGARTRPFQKFLQTDAAINPGNSGGPLLNIRGELIGINTAIISRTGGYDGIGFALASNIAVATYNQIIRYGRVSRGSIGVEFSSNQSPALRRSYGADNGVFVSRTIEDGPADKAGMEAEDIIVKVNGMTIMDGDQLIEIVAGIEVGETIPIEVVRTGKTVKLDVTIADREKLYPEDFASENSEMEDGEEAEVRFGISVQEITPARREQMNLDQEEGVLLTKVEPSSFGDDIGLLRGDVILEVNRQGVSSIRDLRNIQHSLKPGQDVVFKVLRLAGRNWRTLYLAGVLGER